MTDEKFIMVGLGSVCADKRGFVVEVWERRQAPRFRVKYCHSVVNFRAQRILKSISWGKVKTDKRKTNHIS